MCGGSIQSERAARNYTNEVRKSCSIEYTREVVRHFQHGRWLLDYDPITCERKVAPLPPTPRKPRAKPVWHGGMKVVREAVREVKRTPQKAPAREREVSRVN